MSWEKLFEKAGRPLFKCFRKHSMVGVGISVVYNIPSLFIGHELFIDEDAKKLNGGDGWMSIIQLDLILLRKLSPVSLLVSGGVTIFKSLDDVTKRSTAKEILLLQS